MRTLGFFALIDVLTSITVHTTETSITFACVGTIIVVTLSILITWNDHIGSQTLCSHRFTFIDVGAGVSVTIQGKTVVTLAFVTTIGVIDAGMSTATVFSCTFIDVFAGLAIIGEPVTRSAVTCVTSIIIVTFMVAF